MKKLYLIRHAKSSWSDPDVTDFERTLNKRGRRDAPFMGLKLAEAGICPDGILSSPAKRAKLTARIIAKGVGFSEKSITYDDIIYSSSIDDLYRILKKTDKNIGALFFVGHNHTITDLAVSLTGESILNIPTSGIVAMECAIKKWKHLAPGSGNMLFFDYPKRYETK